jgi:hypothetical protein
MTKGILMSDSNNNWLGFDPSTTEAAETFGVRQEPIPNGKYKAVATSAVRKHNKADTGWFWELTFSIIEGQYEGRTVVHRFNMANPSDEAVAIGRSHMKRYLESIGNLEPKDEEALCHIAVFVTVTCKKSTFVNRNGEKVEGINNEVTKIDSTATEPKAQVPAPASTPEKPKTAPWKK